MCNLVAILLDISFVRYKKQEVNITSVFQHYAPLHIKKRSIKEYLSRNVIKHLKMEFLLSTGGLATLSIEVFLCLHS